MLPKGKEKVDDDGKRKGKRKLGEHETGPKLKNRGVLRFTEDSVYQVDEDEEDYDSSSDDSLFGGDDLEREVCEDVNVANNPAMAKEEDIEEASERVVEERCEQGSGLVRHLEDGYESERSSKVDISVPLSYDEVIWKVKCLVNVVRIRVALFASLLRLLALFHVPVHVESKHMGTKLPIVSACAIDHVKGHIFVEARELNDIDESCKGICSVHSTWSVPISISTLYRLALASNKSGGSSQVAAVNHARNKVAVESVPRINLKEMAAKMGGCVAAKSGAIPPQRKISRRERELEFMTNSNIELSGLAKTLQGGYPLFIKLMAESEVRRGFLLSLPKTFCKEHLPKSRVNIVLEDGKGSEYNVKFLYPGCYLSGGWRAFASDHELDASDALLFQLTKPSRFKVYIAKELNNVHSKPIASDVAEPRVPVFEHSNLDESCNNQVSEDDITLEKSVDLEKHPQVYIKLKAFPCDSEQQDELPDGVDAVNEKNGLSSGSDAITKEF